MVKEAEESAEADKTKRELVESQTMADILLKKVKKELDEHKDKFSDEQVENLEQLCSDLESKKTTSDIESLKSSIQALESTFGGMTAR